jgi:ketosteroid isomerase-like protein
MSQQNVEMIDRIFDQAPYDPAVLFESLDDEVHWEVGAIDIPDIGATYWHGPAGVREFFRRWVGPFDDWGIKLDEAIDVGDSVVAHVHQWGRGKVSGAAVEESHWQVWTVRDGKVVRVALHPDREKALQAVGLSE